MDIPGISGQCRIRDAEVLHPLYLQTHNLFNDIFLLQSQLGEMGFDLLIPVRRGRLHHSAVFFLNQVVAPVIFPVKIIQILLQHYPVPGEVLAFPHDGKGGPVVLTAGSSAFVLHLVKSLEFKSGNFLHQFLIVLCRQRCLENQFLAVGIQITLRVADEALPVHLHGKICAQSLYI